MKKWYGHKLINSCNKKISKTVEIIRNSRRRKKLPMGTINEIAAALGLSQNMYIAKEKGGEKFTEKELEQLIFLLDIDPNDFKFFTKDNEIKKTEITNDIKQTESDSKTSLVISNGLPEPIQVQVYVTHGFIRIEIEPTDKKLKDAKWVAPAVQKYAQSNEMFKPEITIPIKGGV